MDAGLDPKKTLAWYAQNEEVQAIGLQIRALVFATPATPAATAESTEDAA